ncbi:hypothetical protein GEMRC1_008084 [Eukaryota sp. GEM-RC1]
MFRPGFFQVFHREGTWSRWTPWDDTVDYDIVSDEEPSSNGTSNEKPFSIENPNEDPSPNTTINEEPSSKVDDNEEPSSNVNENEELSSNVNEDEEPSSNRTPASESNPSVGWTYRPSVTPPPIPIVQRTTPPIRTPEPFIPELPPTPLGFVMPSKDPRAPPPLHAKSPWRELWNADVKMFGSIDKDQWSHFQRQSVNNAESYGFVETDQYLLRPARTLKMYWQRKANGYIPLDPEVSNIHDCNDKLMGFIMDKTRPNSLVTVEQAYNLLRNPLPKDQVEAIEKQVDNLERYTTANSFFHRKHTVNTNSADTVPPLVANTPYVPGGFVFAKKPHAPNTPRPNELPHDHMLEEDHTATRVGALSVSPEPVTPTQSSTNSPNTDVITPYSVLKFAERLPTDSSSDFNKLMKPKSLHSLDDVDVIIDWIADYMSFCTAQKDYTLPASSPLGDPKYFFDIGRIAAKEADTRWVSRLVAYPVQQQMNYLGTATTSSDELFRQIILRTQFKNILTARNKLNEVQMNWSIQDYEQRWLDFIKRFDKVLNRSTLIKSSTEPSYTMLDERTIIKALLTNIGLASLYLELWPKWEDSLQGFTLLLFNNPRTLLPMVQEMDKRSHTCPT